MPGESYLQEADARAVIRLLASVARVKGGPVAQKRALLNKLAQVVPTTRWCWETGYLNAAENRVVTVSFLSEGWSDEDFANMAAGVKRYRPASVGFGGIAIAKACWPSRRRWTSPTPCWRSSTSNCRA